LPQSAFEPPPIPIHLAQFPTIGGLVVPFITLQHLNGKAALGLVDASRMERCLRERCCGVCGSATPGRMVFMMRRIDLMRQSSNEPGLCPPCAAYTQAACPMIVGAMKSYRKSASSFTGRTCGDPACECSRWSPPDTESSRLGAPVGQWYALWASAYDLAHDEAGRLVASFARIPPLRIRQVASAPDELQLVRRLLEASPQTDKE
jgi:hypothetical protein